MKIIGVGVTNRRRDRRIEARPIQVELEGRRYDTLDWSLGGFLIDGYDGRRRPGEPVTVGLTVRAGERTYEHVVRAEIVRITGEAGRLAANFIDPDTQTLDLLESWMTGRLLRSARRKTG